MLCVLYVYLVTIDPCQTDIGKGSGAGVTGGSVGGSVGGGKGGNYGGSAKR